MVASLAINPNTVSKAYRELETKGLIAGRPGQGTFVLTTLSPVTLPELAGLRRSLRGWLAKADTAGLDDSGIAALVASELRDFLRASRCCEYSRRRPRNGGGCMNVIEASNVSKNYGSTQALRECTFMIPAGHVVALVGPNGAGKSTLLNLAVGLLMPTEGSLSGHGGRAPGSRAALNGIAYVAQDTPLYGNLSAADMMHLTRNLNLHFDWAYAETRLGELGIPLTRKAGKLSGGQQAQLALTLALSRHPSLLILDEPVARCSTRLPGTISWLRCARGGGRRRRVGSAGVFCDRRT